MALMTIFITLIVAGLLLYVVLKYIPLDEGVKKIIKIVAIIVLIVWLLQVFGLWGYLFNVKV